MAPANSRAIALDAAYIMFLGDNVIAVFHIRLAASFRFSTRSAVCESAGGRGACKPSSANNNALRRGAGGHTEHARPLEIHQRLI
jgi:hypothetical protein